jgi:epoxyqueuosine reductase
MKEEARLLRELAREEGFDHVGITLPRASEHLPALRGWVERGLHGEMGYLARADAVARRGRLELTLPEVRSILVVGHEYGQPDPAGVPDDPARGVIARYARGRDYHRIVRKGLQRVHRRLEEELGRAVSARAYVDTGPILERELAQRAGLGWFGRNTMLIDPGRGSYFFLGVLLLELELDPDPPFARDHCGSCRACLDACPTGALLGRDESGAPLMDARLCISYLTIENTGPIPRELRPLIGNRIYGCDICQEVCPFNVRFSEQAAEPGYAARGPGERPVGVEEVAADVSADVSRSEGGPDPGGSRGDPGGVLDVWLRRALRGSAETRGRPDGSPGSDPIHPGTDGPALVDLLEMALSEAAWKEFSRGSAIRRAGRAGFARNVCVAMGNWLVAEESPDPAAVELLGRALSDPKPLVRGHAAWALGRVGGGAAAAMLSAAASSEEDPWVAGELEAAR